MRYTAVFLLLSACASAPEYPSPYSPAGAYVDAAPISAVPGVACTSYYYESANSPSSGPYPCPAPVSPAYPAYGYLSYATPFYARTYVRRPVARTGQHTHHSGRRGKK